MRIAFYIYRTVLPLSIHFVVHKQIRSIYVEVECGNGGNSDPKAVALEQVNSLNHLFPTGATKQRRGGVIPYQSEKDKDCELQT